MSNTQIKLAQRPVGLPTADTFNIEKNPIPVPAEGEVLLKTKYISLDPAMRGWMNDARSYIPPVGIGEVMRAGTVSEVMESKNAKYKVGDILVGNAGVQEYIATDGRGYRSVDASLAPLPVFLGTLGMPGFTAYFGLMRIGEPKAGETVLVSGAAGAVGSIVGQIAKLKGCRVVGIAGGKDKCDYIVNELGFDAAIDYKAGNLHAEMKAACPDRIDVYFDNVGGEILDAALGRLNMHARIIICGAISQYNNTTPVKGPANYLSLLVSRAKMQGMVVFDYAADYGIAAQEMAAWMKEGKLKTREDVYEGIENFHETFLRLFSGKKMGKLVLKV
ncbi:MAG: NADPH-dependent curcumin reductase CurA [Saprospiraceae bacterium]|jgi:NADPH-dependent curcumin reductase CurA